MPKHDEAVEEHVEGEAPQLPAAIRQRIEELLMQLAAKLDDDASHGEVCESRFMQVLYDDELELHHPLIEAPIMQWADGKPLSEVLERAVTMGMNIGYELGKAGVEILPLELSEEKPKAAKRCRTH